MNIPEIVTSQERKVLDFIKERLELSEPAFVLGIRGLGKNVIFNNIDITGLLKQGYKVERHIITDKSKLERIAVNLDESSDSPLAFIASLSLNETGSEFLHKLSQLREKRNARFVSVILSDLRSGLDSFNKKEKIVVRSLFTLKPLGFDDTLLLIASLEKRFNCRLTKSDKDDIYKLSGGHVGLIKTTVLLKKDKPEMSLQTDTLLKEESILNRLQDIFSDFPEEIKSALVKNKSDSESVRKFLERFGLSDNGRLFSQLLSKYIKKNFFKTNYLKSNLLTGMEKNLMTFFENNVNEISKREELAKIIWATRWEEEYSEWAIDQTIHRLRIKLKKAKSPYKIITKKGQGFILQEM